MSMWEPFTERARRSIVQAQEEAQRLGNNYIGAQHLLLGVLDGEGGVSTVFTSLGVTVSRARDVIVGIYGRGGQTVWEEMVFTPHSKRVIELSFEEARELQQGFISTGHLMLALLREGSLNDVFDKLNVDTAIARERVLAEGLDPSEHAQHQWKAQSLRFDLPFSRVHHVQFAMPSEGEAQARVFYGNVLGMTEVEKPEALKPRGGAWFTSGVVNVHLGVDAEFRPSQKAHAAFCCPDFAGMLVRLADAKVSVRSAADTLPDGSRHVYVDDPFGNRIELVEQQ